MKRIWHKVRKVEIKQHDSGIVEIQRLPLLLTTPLLVAGGVVAVTSMDGARSSPYAPLVAFTIVAVIGLLLLLSLVFAIEIAVRDGQVIFGVRPFYVHRVAVADLKSWHPLTLHAQGNDVHWYGRGSGFPVPDYRGYASIVPDTHGVELSLLDGRHVFISTAHPDRLMHAIANAKLGATVS